jgi:nitrogen fixation NifU-like protein
MMTQKVKGRSKEEAIKMAAVFRGIVTGENRDEPAEDAMGELQLLVGVQQFPARVKCAMLGWRAMEQAVMGQGEGQE